MSGLTELSQWLTRLYTVFTLCLKCFNDWPKGYNDKRLLLKYKQKVVMCVQISHCFSKLTKCQCLKKINTCNRTFNLLHRKILENSIFSIKEINECWTVGFNTETNVGHCQRNECVVKYKIRMWWNFGQQADWTTSCLMELSCS